MPERTCAKHIYYSQRDAQAALVEATMQREQGIVKRQERRFYVCDICTLRESKGVWHLSSREQAGESEGDFTRWLIGAMQLKGWVVTHIRPAMVDGRWMTPYEGDTGLPDIIAIREGRILLAELKSEAGRVRPEQQKWLDHGAHLWRPSDRPAILAVIE
jgi:hypothetical protein